MGGGWACNATEGVVAPLFVGDGSDGEGVGLAGYTGRLDYFVLIDDIVKRRPKGVATFVVHPAIAGYPLGEDALLVDAYPFLFPDKLEKIVKSAAERINDAASIENLKTFNAWLTEENRRTYKFVDVPLQIVRSETGIIFPILPELKSQTWPDQIRRQSFLTFQEFDESGEPKEENPAFYSITPLLIAAWPNFSRLNDYAGVLAIVRWLRANDAVWQGGLDEPERHTALTSLVIGDDVGPKLLPSLFEAKVNLAEQVLHRAEELVGQASPIYTKLNHQIHESRLERLAAQEAISIYGLRTIAPSDQTDLLLGARHELKIMESILKIPSEEFRNFLILKLLDRHKIDVTGLPSSQIIQHFKKLKTIYEKEVRDLERKIANTQEGQFISRLESHEKKLANKNPLAAGRASVRRQFVESIPDSAKVLYQSILNERSTLLKDHSEIMSVVEQLKVAEVQPNVNSEEVLLKWVATDGERNKAQSLSDLINTLTNETENPNSGFFGRLRAKNYLSDAKHDREQLIKDLRKGRLSSKIELLNKKANDINESAEKKKKNAEIEMDRLIASAPVPLFEEWWKLQTSFCDQLFSK